MSTVKEIVDAYFFGLQLTANKKIYKTICIANDCIFALTDTSGHDQYVVQINAEKFVLRISRRFATKDEITYGYRTCVKHFTETNERIFSYNIEDTELIKEALNYYEEYFCRVVGI